ncbi:MAG: hypothetical protein QG671_3403, partial [Actinomycetota bacterium]|nr:hypothetical protein [Actinomycetota bacterium]
LPAVVTPEPPTSVQAPASTLEAV